MLLPAEYNFTIWQGSTWTWQFTLSLAGAPYPATIDSARMQIRDQDFALLASLSTTPTATQGDITIVSTATEHTIYCTLSAVMTAAMAAGKVQYDIELVAGDVVEKPYYGRKCVIQPEVTL